ncbi:hypothetical protein DL766_004337 [Monosporascus sp. MC13-8B]|nr:hypothetical protein DL763_002200 [Monosporascus cannonballus]RYP31561.1 hypothetical protein DL766_004337 [Monosporascus sp. MC13-8B]
MALGTKFLSKPWLPSKLRMVHAACISFHKYMTDLFEEEKDSVHSSNDNTPRDRNLMTALIQASESEKEHIGTSTGGLTETEIYGNMFVFNFAGHDTTAHTLTFVVMFLAANPMVQEWLSKELRYVFGQRSPGDGWDYHADFPRLKRCLAVLMETIRLYTPVPVAKWTGPQAQTLRISEKTIGIPPNTMVIPSYAAMHTHPKYWGPDPLTWRPSRWIKSRDPSSESLLALDNEELVTPQRGTFFPWSEGERSCPGKKFSQVEFVATLAVLFRDWKVDPVASKHESIDDARKRVFVQIETDSAQVLLLQMLHPERVPLVWTKK